MKKVFLIANILISTNTFAQTNGWIDPRHHDLDKSMTNKKNNIKEYTWIDPRHHDLDKSMTNNKEKQGKNKHIKK